MNNDYEHDQVRPDIYQQVHDFTPAGAQRFAAWMAERAKAGDEADKWHRLECLGVIEDNLNSPRGGPLSWELAASSSIDGQRHTFTAELDDLIVEHVQPDE